LIDLYIKDKGLARPLQDRISDFNNTELLPALAEICDQLVEPNQFIRIDKLELDIGSISLDRFESDLREGVVKQFKEQVQKQVLNNPDLIETLGDNNEIEDSGTKNIQQTILRGPDLLVYFLENGTKPWWQSSTEFSMKKIVEEVILTSPGSFFKRISPLLDSNIIRQRLAETLTTNQLLRLIGLDEQPNVKTIWKELEMLFQKGFFKPTAFYYFKRVVFADVLSQINAEQTNSRKLTKLQQAIILNLFKTRPDFVNYFSEPAKLPSPKLDEHQLVLTIFESIEPGLISRILKKYSESLTDVPSINKNKIEQKEESKIVRKLSKETFIEINNAGIVLLWPYLEMFFKELKIVREKNFVDDESRWKAVQLLHYLVFGNQEAEEHDWVLNKILCGMEISDFVPVEFEVTELEKEECYNLLKSVVRNWTALKNSSVAGLQQAFLRRNGLLKDDPDGFLIEIERNSLDVLLDRLTWSISVIRLPWVKELIHVKW